MLRLGKKTGFNQAAVKWWLAGGLFAFKTLDPGLNPGEDFFGSVFHTNVLLQDRSQFENMRVESEKILKQ